LRGPARDLASGGREGSAKWPALSSVDHRAKVVQERLGHSSIRVRASDAPGSSL
jgi:hypothetical protein